MCSMKKCKGCGAPIQNKDPKMAGYSVNLEQDYWGILCDIAIKKGIKKGLEDCIGHVEVV